MPEPTDRRKVERYPVNSDTSCPFVSPVVENFGPVKLRDLSTEGLGLLVTRRLEPGTLLTVTLANQAKGITKTVLVRVVHVTPHPGAFLIGGTFITPLTYEELTKFIM